MTEKAPQRSRVKCVLNLIYIIQLVNKNRTRVQLPPAPPLALPDTSGQILKARMAQALRAFLCLLLSEDIQLNPVIIGIRLGIR